MPFDDDDVPTAAVIANPVEGSEEAPTAEEALEEETQDFRLFATLFRKKGVSSQTVRKGEKDFESHGTRAQQNALEQSRQAMQDVLSYTRVYKPNNWIRGWYFPDWLAEWPGGGDDCGERRREPVGDDAARRDGAGVEKRPDYHVRDRVVIVEGEGGIAGKTMGRVVTGQAKDRPARDKTWLLPEEALFLVERGSLDLWWPVRGLESILAGGGAKELLSSELGPVRSGSGDDEYDLGVPLSLEAAYSLLVGDDGKRGKVSLQKFQVYSNLKRGGYKVLRAPPAAEQPSPCLRRKQGGFSIWQWLFNLISSGEPERSSYGPLVQPGLYRSYQAVYQQIALIPRHKPNPEPSSPWAPQEPFRIHFHVWKSGTAFSKTRPPPPDFYLSVVDAQDSMVPTLEEVAALLDTTPWAPPKAEWTGPGRMYPRLKHGYRNVILAVVDHGIINYMRIAEAAFGEDTLVHRFDSKQGLKGKKGGGRNGSRGGKAKRGGGQRR